MYVCDDSVWVHWTGKDRLSKRATILRDLQRLLGEDRGTTRKKALVGDTKAVWGTHKASLDVDMHDTAAFVDKYIDRLKIGFS